MRRYREDGEQKWGIFAYENSNDVLFYRKTGAELQNIKIYDWEILYGYTSNHHESITCWGVDANAIPEPVTETTDEDEEPEVPLAIESRSESSDDVLAVPIGAAIGAAFIIAITIIVVSMRRKCLKSVTQSNVKADYVPDVSVAARSDTELRMADVTTPKQTASGNEINGTRMVKDAQVVPAPDAAADEVVVATESANEGQEKVKM